MASGGPIERAIDHGALAHADIEIKADNSCLGYFGTVELPWTKLFRNRTLIDRTLIDLDSEVT